MHAFMLLTFKSPQQAPQACKHAGIAAKTARTYLLRAR
jgi:hypothetical protein